MTLGSRLNKGKNKGYYTTLGWIFGSGIALFLAELGLDIPIGFGFVMGLSIGTGIDNHNK